MSEVVDTAASLRRLETAADGNSIQAGSSLKASSSSYLSFYSIYDNFIASTISDTISSANADAANTADRKDNADDTKDTDNRAAAKKESVEGGSDFLEDFKDTDNRTAAKKGSVEGGSDFLEDFKDIDIRITEEIEAPKDFGGFDPKGSFRIEEGLANTADPALGHQIDKTLDNKSLGSLNVNNNTADSLGDKAWGSNRVIDKGIVDSSFNKGSTSVSVSDSFGDGESLSDLFDDSFMSGNDSDFSFMDTEDADSAVTVSDSDLLNALAEEVNVQKVSIVDTNTSASKIRAYDLKVFNATEAVNDAKTLNKELVDLSLKSFDRQQQIEDQKSFSATSMYNTQSKSEDSAASLKETTVVQPGSMAFRNFGTANSQHTRQTLGRLDGVSNAGGRSDGRQVTVEAAIKAQQSSPYKNFSLNNNLLETAAKNASAKEELIAALSGAKGAGTVNYGVVQNFLSAGNEGGSLTSALNLLHPALSAIGSLAGSGPGGGGTGGFAGSFSGQQNMSSSSTQSSFTEGGSLNLQGSMEDNVNAVHEMVMSMASRNIRQMIVDLNPSSLGQMTINLSLGKNNTLSKVSVKAENAQTRGIIAKMLPSLNQRLQSFGFDAAAELEEPLTA